MLTQISNRSRLCHVERMWDISVFVFEIFSGKLSTTRLVALLSVKLLMLGIIQVHLILHSLSRNICSVGMT